LTEEAVRATAHQFDNFSRRTLTVRKVKPRWTISAGHLSTQSLNIVLKNQFIWLRTPGEEAFGATLSPSENCE